MSFISISIGNYIKRDLEINPLIMKILISIFCFTTLTLENGIAQEFRSDNRSQMQKEDDINIYKSENISSLDLLQALEISGISIHKYNLGKFTIKCHLYILVDEYTNGEIVKTDTILNEDNTYHYYLESDTVYYIDYIDQIKVISKLEDDILKLQFITYAQDFLYKIKYKLTEDGQFFKLRDFKETKWELNRKIPLLVFASSWRDVKYNYQRFCGVVNLSVGDKDTKLLLDRSPKYFEIYYKVVEYKDK